MLAHPFIQPAHTTHFRINRTSKGCTINGKRAAVLHSGSRAKYFNRDVIVKFDDCYHQSIGDRDFMLYIAKHADFPFFVPTIQIAPDFSYSIQPYLQDVINEGPVKERYYTQAFELASRHHVGDWHCLQWGVTPDGLLAIWDYGIHVNKFP